jgi:hypothetical protein
MKWALIILGSLALLVAIVVIIGALLPRAHTATRVATYRQSAGTLFAAARDFATQPSWRTGLVRVDILPPRNGRHCHVEVSKHGAITYAVDEERPGEKLVMRIADEKLPFGGTWTFEFTASGEGAAVRITEHGEVKNPLFRFMARFAFGYTATMEAYLRDLGRKFGESTDPRP